MILATGFSAEGEATAHVLAAALKARGLSVTRLARGVPVGSELEYVDLSTLAHALHDRRFADLPQLIEPGDLLVFNDTRVIKARLLGRKESGGRIEVMIERIVDARHAVAQGPGDVLSRCRKGLSRLTRGRARLWSPRCRD